MKLELTQLFLPIPNINNDHVTYENQFSPKRIFHDHELEQLFEKHRASVIKIVETEISTYVNDDDLCYDEAIFPRKCFLTGEWYIREIDFERIDYLAVDTALVGNDLGYKEDYLGLEILLHYDQETDAFYADAINSRAL